MITITVKASSIWIEPYRRYSVSSLEKSLSVYDVPTRRYSQFLYEFDNVDDNNRGTLKIPKGYGLSTIEKHFKEANIQNYIVKHEEDNVSKPRNVTIKMRDNFSKPRDEYQEDAIEFLIKNKATQKFLSLSTGFGKTFCSIYYMSKINIPSLIISKNLSDQWLEFITDYTKSQNAIDIEVLQGSEILHEYSLAKGAKNKKHKASFYITTIDTLRSFATRFGSDALQVLSDNLGIGVKIFDEAHTNYIMLNKIDQNMQVKETLYLSATPGRSNQAEDRIFKKITIHIPMHGVYTHSIDKYYYINKITFDSSPPLHVVDECSTKRGFNSKRFSEYMFSTGRGKAFVYALILDILLKIFKSDREAKVLILLDWLRDIQWLHDILEKNKILRSYGIEAGMYCSIITNKELREKELENNIIIGTLGSLSAGHDIPNLRVVIPFTTYSSSIIARQLLGRLRYIKGKALYYFDIADEGFPAMIRQRNERMKIFTPRAKKIIDKYVTFDEVLATVTNKLQE